VVGLFSCSDRQENLELENNARFCVGTYVGTAPCASCLGIKTIITIHKDSTFIKSEEHLGGDNIFYNNIGNYHLNFNDSVIDMFY
jgi:hypothetical protein